MAEINQLDIITKATNGVVLGKIFLKHCHLRLDLSDEKKQIMSESTFETRELENCKAL